MHELRPSADAPEETLVVGGGIIGVAIAHELASRGVDVLLVEQGPTLGTGCSSGSAGLIVPSHALPIATPRAVWHSLRWILARDSPFSIRLTPDPRLLVWLMRFLLACRPSQVKRSLALIRALALASAGWYESTVTGALAERSQLSFRGCLNVYETKSALRAGRRESELVATDAMQPRFLTALELHQLAPSLARGAGGGILWASDGHCDSHALTEALGWEAVSRGARIVTGCEVLGITRGAGSIKLETTQGPFKAGRLVLAAGVRTAELARQCGCRLPLQSGKGYHVDLAGGPELHMPIFLQGAKVTLTPLDGRIRVTGVLELNGSGTAVSQRRVAGILAAARRWVPELGAARPVGVWRGLRPCAPDGVPIIGVTRDPRVLIASAHSMMGVSLAPITAQLIADLITDRSPSFDLAPLSPMRF